MKNFFKKHKKLCIIIAIVLVLAIVAVFVFNPFSKGQISVTTSYKEVEVERRNIERSITGSSSLQPANSYSVSSRYEGEITADYIEEGDTVTKGQELYIIDSSDIENSDSLLITAPVSGYISSLSIKQGDSVKTNQVVAQIVDDSQLTITFNFSSVDASNIKAGQSATLILDSTFEEIEGTVDSVSLVSEAGNNNMRTKSVTISVQNPGSLDSSYLATAKIGDAVSINPAYFEYVSSKSVVAEASGDVYKIYAEKGTRVTKGSLIASLSDASDNLHSITSPIDGSVVDKTFKQGENASSSRTLCVIYDLSYLEMSLSVDELDIADVSVGQEVQITADAREGQKYTGYVSKVSIAGSNNNGTATYPVTVRIDDYGDLLPSMTADATIYMTQEQNVIAIQSSAVQRGNTVLITADSPTAKTLAEQGQEPNEDGYYTATIETGISDDTYIQVISGLQDGDKIAYAVRSLSSSGGLLDGLFGGGGNMPSGGDFPSGGNMPSGGGGGNFPSGGGSGNFPSGGGGGNMPSGRGGF